MCFWKTDPKFGFVNNTMSVIFDNQILTIEITGKKQERRQLMLTAEACNEMLTNIRPHIKNTKKTYYCI